MVANTILFMVGIVGMGGSEEASEVLVVLGMMVGVAHDEADGGAGGLSFEHAAQQFHTVCLLARSGEVALAGTAAVQLMLDESHVYGNAGGHPVDDTANGKAMAFAKRGQGENVSKRVSHLSTYLTATTTAAAAFTAAAIVLSAAAAAFTTATAAATATASAEICHHLVYLFLRGGTTLQYLPDEVKVEAGQRMVEGHLDRLLADFQYQRVEAVAFAIAHGDDGPYVDDRLVQLPIAHEDAFGEVYLVLRMVFILSKGFGDDEVECVACVHGREFGVELREGHAHVADEPEGLVLGGVFQQLVLAVDVGIHLVRRHDVLVLFLHFVSFDGVSMQNYTSLSDYTSQKGLSSPFLVQKQLFCPFLHIAARKHQGPT